jgi:hypothetical protein
MPDGVTGGMRDHASERVAFHVPLLDARFGSLPRSATEYWSWISAQDKLGARGPFNWTLQSCLQLAAHGIPCEIVRSIPDDGVIVALACTCVRTESVVLLDAACLTATASHERNVKRTEPGTITVGVAPDPNPEPDARPAVGG